MSDAAPTLLHEAQEPPQAMPFATRNDAQRVKDALAGGRWLFAADLLALAGVSDRMLRALGEQWPDLLITGNLGYKLAEFATVEEIEACANRIGGQRKKMQAREDALRTLAASRAKAAA